MKKILVILLCFVLISICFSCRDTNTGYNGKSDQTIQAIIKNLDKYDIIERRNREKLPQDIKTKVLDALAQSTYDNITLDAYMDALFSNVSNMVELSLQSGILEAELETANAPLSFRFDKGIDGHYYLDVKGTHFGYEYLVYKAKDSEAIAQELRKISEVELFKNQ